MSFQIQAVATDRYRLDDIADLLRQITGALFHFFKINLVLSEKPLVIVLRPCAFFFIC